MPPKRKSRGRKSTKTKANSNKKNQPEKELSDNQAATAPDLPASDGTDKPGCSRSNEISVDNISKDFIPTAPELSASVIEDQPGCSKSNQGSIDNISNDSIPGTSEPSASVGTNQPGCSKSNETSIDNISNDLTQTAADITVSVIEDQPGCSKSSQGSIDNVSNDFIFLSDSDPGDMAEIFPSSGNRKSKSDTDSIRSISPHRASDCTINAAPNNAVVAAYATVATSSSPQPKKKKGRSKGRTSSRNAPSMPMALNALAGLLPFNNNGLSNIPTGRGKKKPAKRSKKSRSKRSRAISSPELMESEEDLSYDSDNSCMLGMSPKGKGTTKKKAAVAAEVSKDRDSELDKWSDSSSDSEGAIKKDVASKKKKIVPKGATDKPKVSTDWSEEDLANVQILPEAAIFSNRIKDYNEQLKEFRKTDWMTKASMEKDIFKTKIDKKKRKKKSRLVFEDDSDEEIAAKIPDVVPQVISDEDEDVDLKKVKMDETITEEHISKTVQMRIMRKLRRMQEETKRILVLPAGYAHSSDEDDDEIQNLSDSEVNPDIIVKVRWECELLKISMKLNESFVKVFDEIAQKVGIKRSEIMILLKDRTVTIEDTPKSLGITAGDILDSCAYNVKSKAEDVSAKVNFVQIMIQSSDSKAKQSFSIHKLEPLLNLMQKYSSERGIPLEKMLFEFDGEKIDPGSSAVDLDMDEDCCIDVKIL